MTNNYKILNLHAENVKRLKVIDITPDPDNNIVTISGKNGQGKTSVLDSILWGIAGKDKIQGKPIRDGEEKAEIKIDLGEYTITRTFTEKDSYLKVENKDGFKTSSPQVMLDNLVGSISFDPLAFTRMDVKKQYTELRSLVDLDIDIEELDTQNKKDFDERTLVNRDVKSLQAQVNAVELFPDDTPDKPVDVSSLVAERDAIQEVDKSYNALHETADNLDDLIDKVTLDIAEMNLKLEEANKKLAEAKKELSDAEKPNMKRIEEIELEITNSKQTNENVTAKLAKTTLSAQLVTKQSEADRLTSNMVERKQEKTKALSDAKFPVEGLSFDDGIVLFNEIPFDQASNAEQIRVSTAIAMASNPKIRVIRIKDGSLLDDDSMNALRDMAKEHDFQVWVERVGSDEPCAVILEDGEIKS